MDPINVYMLIVAMVIIGIIITLVVFLNSENALVGVAIAGIITLAGLAYGIEVRNNAKIT